MGRRKTTMIVMLSEDPLSLARVTRRWLTRSRLSEMEKKKAKEN